LFSRSPFARREEEQGLEVLHEICCGLDIHKQTVAACLRRGRKSEVKTFGTSTRELLKLSDWLKEAGCTHVAMESTGVYWKLIFNILEGDFEMMLVNAKHIKAVPGRKTDVKDSEWIAQLLAHGLLQPSFVPERGQRELRELTRHRVKLIQQHSAVVNRVHKVLEDANIKLACVASDIMGVSGRAILEAIASGKTEPNSLADMSLRALRKRIPELREALEGRVTEHHRFMLRELLDQLKYLEGAIERASERIEEMMRPFVKEIELVNTVTGLGMQLTQQIISEIGVDMSQFPDERHLCSWAKICPGNNESAGKHKSGKTGRGNNWLKSALTQAAWVASKMKGTYLSALYHRIARRRGKKRAIVAVAHAILVAIYHILREKCPYEELGSDFFDRANVDRVKNQMVRRLESLGFCVTLEPTADVA
jgi:transposase